MTLRTLNYGNYGIFLIMGNAGFCPSTVSHLNHAKSLALVGASVRLCLLAYLPGSVPYPYRGTLRVAFKNQTLVDQTSSDRNLHS